MQSKTALPISTKIAEGDEGETGARFYAQIAIGPEVQVTVYESLTDAGVAIIDIERGEAGEPESTKVKVAINDWYVDDTTDEKPAHFDVLDLVLGEFDQTRVQIGADATAADYASDVVRRLQQAFDL